MNLQSCDEISITLTHIPIRRITSGSSTLGKCIWILFHSCLQLPPHNWSPILPSTVLADYDHTLSICVGLHCPMDKSFTGTHRAIFIPTPTSPTFNVQTKPCMRHGVSIIPHSVTQMLIRPGSVRFWIVTIIEYFAMFVFHSSQAIHHVRQCVWLIWWWVVSTPTFSTISNIFLPDVHTISNKVDSNDSPESTVPIGTNLAGTVYGFHTHIRLQTPLEWCGRWSWCWSNGGHHLCPESVGHGQTT